MTREIFLDLTREALLTAVMLGGPPLLVSLVVGLVISLIQAVTQLNESTLTFIPKVVAILAVLVLLGPWMLESMLDFARGVFLALPRMAR
ncbi:MAG: flagellar biosynthesis protein FliQ [Candidatus Sericytochromatia bacterium]|nr:flagellar biosynthesis protein FliQ [Candidatus Sericytochromatia bacterium]